MYKNSDNNSQFPKGHLEVLFFGRANCEDSFKALNHLIRLGCRVTSIFSKGHGESFPEKILSWSGDYIFCFRSMFILPKSLINQARIAAINFHPGPPEYPGSGCLNFALYEESKLYGVTSHLMTEKVDDGSIIECRRFSIDQADTVNSLLERTHAKLLDLFFDVSTAVAMKGKSYLEYSINGSIHEKWSGKKRKIKDLDALSIVDLNISEAELIKLIKATYTENFPPKVVLHGYEFFLKSDEKL